MSNFREQLRNNAVALVSLVVALIGLMYTTWRYEHTERNQNIRTATFEILSKLAEFERVVFLAHYDKDVAMGNPRVGWTYVIAIHDLSGRTRRHRAQGQRAAVDLERQLGRPE